MLTYHQNDTREFATWKATAILQANRVQPHLGAIGVALDVYVRWLIAIASLHEPHRLAMTSLISTYICSRDWRRTRQRRLSSRRYSPLCP